MKEERKSVPTKLQDLAEKEGFLFAEISDYEGYYVTTDGRVWGKQKNDFLNPADNAQNYWWVNLSQNGVVTKKYVHRLVAMAFIPNPQNKPEVNHKDENPSNNSVDNLEWMTSKENNNYGTHKERARISQLNRKDLSKPVVQMSKEGDILAMFFSTKEAQRQTGAISFHIGAVCNKLPCRKTAGGYLWRWATEAEAELLRKG